MTIGACIRACVSFVLNRVINVERINAFQILNLNSLDPRAKVSRVLLNRLLSACARGGVGVTPPKQLIGFNAEFERKCTEIHN